MAIPVSSQVEGSGTAAASSNIVGRLPPKLAVHVLPLFSAAYRLEVPASKDRTNDTPLLPVGMASVSVSLQRKLLSVGSPSTVNDTA